MKSYVIAAFILPFVLAAKEAVERWWDKRQAEKAQDPLFTVATLAPPPLLSHDRSDGNTSSGSSTSERTRS